MNKKNIPMDPKQTQILYVNQGKSDKFTINDDIITWRGDRNREYFDRTGLCTRVIMIERDARIDCHILREWTTQISGQCTHTFKIGEIIATYPDANYWFKNYVGEMDGSFRGGWGLNRFMTSVAALRKFIPSFASYTYYTLQNKLYEITGDRDVNSCYIQFIFYNRGGVDACAVEPVTAIDEEDEFGIYGDCDDLATFVIRLQSEHGIKYIKEEDDYRITRADVTGLFSQDSDFPIKPCRNKTEKKLETMMRTWGWQVATQATFRWARKMRSLRYDFLVTAHGRKFIIELDGRQHFEDVAHFRSVATVVQANDNVKANLALTHDLNVVRIFQEAVWGDTYDWQSHLKKTILDLNDQVDVYYVAKDDSVYDAHRALMC